MAREWVEKFFGWVHPFWQGIRAIFEALTLIRFNIVLGVVCSIALYTGQGQDILRALVEVEPWYNHAIPRLCFLLFTLSFALTAWYFARVMFSFQFPMDAQEEKALTHVSLENVKHHVTRWLGPIILVMVSGAMMMAAWSYESFSDPPSLQLLSMAIFLAGCGLCILYVGYRQANWFQWGKAQYQHFTSFADLPPISRRWFWGANIASVTAFVSFSYQSGEIGPWIGTAGILMLWATTLVAIGGALVYAGNQYRIPVIGFVAVLVIVFSLFNDNHRVRQTTSMRPYEEQQEKWVKMPTAIQTTMAKLARGIIPRGLSMSDDPLKKYFLDWFRDLEENWRNGRHGREGHDGPIPVILVSTEGGGIRAAYWTAAVLAELQDRSEQLVEAGKIPLNFSRHVFSISGVSGGSLGAAVFASMMKERDQVLSATLSKSCQLHTQSSSRDIAKAVLNQDFLSPTVGVLLFPDMFQRFLPFPILDDRALALEEAWERAWTKCTKLEDFSHAFDDLWNDHLFDVPLLFLNSTVVETGQRLIMHPLPFISPYAQQGPNSTPPTTFQHYFNNALDGPAVLGGQIPLSTAVHMSARFTYVSPAGTIFRQDLPRHDSEVLSSEPEVIRVVDGGYFENSGAVTTDEILLAIRRIGEENNLQIHPIVIHISNDPLKRTERKQEEFTGRRAWLPEILSPVWALLNVRPARGYQAREELGGRAELGFGYTKSEKPTGGSFAHFQLCEFHRRLPLGWMLSDLTRQDMDKQLPTLESNTDKEFEKIATFNLNLLTMVLDSLEGNFHSSGNQTDLLRDYQRDCLKDKL